MLHVSRETVQYWIKTGRLAPVVPERSEKNQRRRPETVKAWKYMVRRADVVNAATGGLESKLQTSHPDKNLLTVKQIAKILQINVRQVYVLINRTGVKKYPLYTGARFYLIDGEEFHWALKEDPLYSFLIDRASDDLADITFYG